MKAVFQSFNKIRLELEEVFRGLGFPHQVLVNILLNRVNFQTGIVENISYNDLAALLTVEPGPGKRNTGKPTKQTVRSYLRTLEMERGTYFKSIGNGKELKFQFPTLPILVKKFFPEPEEYITEYEEQYIEETQDFTELNAFFPDELSTEEYTSIYNNKYITTTTLENFSSEKKCIDEAFYPDEQTLQKAFDQGFTNAADPKEVNAFINYNKARASAWADFNPVYLRWLERGNDYQKKQQQSTKEQGILRRKSNGSSKRATYSGQEALAAVHRANPEIWNPSESELDVGGQTYCLGLERINPNLRQSVYS